MSKMEKAISWMEATATDNSHGYDQQHRWGEKGDYDCSAAVITAWEQAGVPVKSNGATYTGNIYKVFTANGFADVTAKIALKTGSGLKRGDVLLAEGRHVAMYCGNGMEVEASINENGKTTGGKPGDQTGREFLIRAYRNYPWTKILRYGEIQNGEKTTVEEAAKAVLAGTYGNGEERKAKLKALGLDPDEVQKKVNEMLGQGTSNPVKTTSSTKISATYVVTAKNGLNFRSSAGVKKNNVIRALAKGTKVTGTGKTEKVGGTDWYQVKIDGKVGWVSGDYIAPR